MLRDRLRDKNYFDGAIAHTDERIAHYQQRLDEPEKLVPLGRMGGSVGLCQYLLNRMMYGYSRGDAINDFQPNLVDLLKYRELQKKFADALPSEDANRRVEWERLDFSNYKKTFSWLAFAVAAGAPKEYLSKLFYLVDNQGLDALFDRIAVALGDSDRPVAEKVLHSKPYGLLLSVIDAAPSEQAALMNKFMNAWYPACAKNGFYETHNITNNFGYGGYWCFEAALVTMVFKLDDTGYKNHKYYPADLTLPYPT